MRPLKVPAVCLGLAFLFSILMLGPLLGQTADSSATYTAHFASDTAVTRDLLGGLGLVVTGAMLIWVVAVVNYTVIAERLHVRRGLALAFGLVAAATLTSAAGLLLTVPFVNSLASVTDDDGIAGAVQAGIAQAGSVLLFVAAYPLAVTTVLLGTTGVAARCSPRWVGITAWVTGGLLFLGFTVGLLLPFAIWAIGFGLTWKQATEFGPSVSVSPN